MNMKKAITVLSILLMTINHSQAQNDPSGIVIDYVKVDKIDCWSFDEMDLIFPYDRNKWNKYDMITVRLYWGPFVWVPFLDFTKNFTREKAEEYFSGSKYGVWKIMRDKKKDELSGVYKRKDFAKSKSATLYVEILGYVQKGFDVSGQATYSQPTILYKSKTIESIKCKYDAEAKCTLSGEKLDLKIDPSGGYDENFGIIKSDGTVNSEVSTKVAQPINTNVQTEAKNSNTTVSKDASGLQPMDKKKAGYYETKDGNFISDQGYKIKGKLEGEYRSYSSGKLEYVFTFKNDIKEGAAAEYYENGKVKESGMYKNDKKEGEWKRFTEGGKPAGTDVYIDGEKQ
jgi:antitoxin component YwqK of YwqJK toxin-antitoxin module